MKIQTLIVAALLLLSITSFAQITTTETTTHSTTITTGGMGIGFDVKITEGQGHTTTSTHHHSTNHNHHPVYISNYTGRIGCPVPQSNVQGIIAAMNQEDFADDKMAVAQQAVRNKCFVAKDIKQIASQFSFADDKLAFAKFAYYSTYDIDNYYILNSIFEFSDDKAALNAFISQQ
ncbi:DUF4476 domain-containing protein [Aureispira anguillae]|uniref:DUF4476 domain-containing protein n=1 Tax=Aureispira anguillae TaxID=2864201 RepID=A0A915YJW8_9BACT|nr:DUF4476 domain-containing protein [Aureispira anguillae]BDS14317.1 DUF4476 domain-containing protein [Aureispira anguillae]